MKKILVLACSTIAAMAAAVSCNTIEINNQSASNGKIIIRAGVPADPATKTVLAEGNSVKFVEGDELSVFNKETSNSRFTMSDGPFSDGSADFEGEIGSTRGGLTLFVLYPYQSTAGAALTQTANHIYANVPEIQTIVAGTFDPKAALSVGCSIVADGATETSIPMTSACALLKFRIPEDMQYKKLVLYANDGSPMSGNVEVNINGQGTLLRINALETDKSVTLLGDFECGKDYYFAAIPGTYEGGITVDLYTSTDAKAGRANFKTTEKDVVLQAGHIAKLGTLDECTNGIWEGKGSEDLPFLIQDLDDLLTLQAQFATIESAEQYTGMWFKQTADIDCGGAYVSIAGWYGDGLPYGVRDHSAFEANYDGGGHLIENYSLQYNNRSFVKTCDFYYGLFNCIKNSTIKNLRLSPAAGIVMPDEIFHDDCHNIGFLAGSTEGNIVIENVTVEEGSYSIKLIEANRSAGECNIAHIGGLLGEASWGDSVTITGCTNHADIKVEGGQGYNNGDFNNTIGGILGYAGIGSQTITIDRCRNYGNITDASYYGETSSAGGLVGTLYAEDESLHMSNCVNYGTVSTCNIDNEYSYSGGMLGYYNQTDYCDPLPYIFNCLNKGKIKSNGNDAVSGGMIGYCFDERVQIAMCVNTGILSGEGDVHLGGMCGIGSWEIDYIVVPYRHNPTCITCQWLNQYDSSGELITIDCCWWGDEFYDCNALDDISSDDLNDYITNGKVNKNAQANDVPMIWSDQEWKDKTVKWTGWASKSDRYGLELNF